METDPTRMSEKLVGLGDVELVGIDDLGEGEPLVVVIRSRMARPTCEACGGRVWSKGYRTALLVDLPAFGRPVRLRWRKRRWTCPNPECAIRSFIEQDPTIGPQRALLTSRAARWVTVQVGRSGRSVDEVAAELGCDWHTVNNEVRRWGEALLEADGDRVGAVEAVGVDETLFWRKGRWRTKQWWTSVVDVGGHQLIDIVAGRTANSAEAWFRSQPAEWLDGIRWAVLDMSGPYRKAYDRVLPHAPGSRPIPRHPLSQPAPRRSAEESRTKPSVKLTRSIGYDASSPPPTASANGARHGCVVLLNAGDPHGEVRTAWHAKNRPASTGSTSRSVHLQLADDLQDQSCPPEINKLGRTIARWTPQITNWHISKVTNGPTEALNNLIKRIKRTAFGFRNFSNYRIRALLYAGKPNWDLLASVTPH